MKKLYLLLALFLPTPYHFCENPVTDANKNKANNK